MIWFKNTITDFTFFLQEN